MILMIHNAKLGQSKNTAHNAEYSVQGVWLIREERTQTMTKPAMN